MSAYRRITQFLAVAAAGASILAATFTDDKQNGVTTTEEIGMACQGYLLKGDLG